MEKIKFVQPTLDYKDQALDFIREFYLYKSPLEGVNGLHRYLNNYEEWLLKIDNDRTNEVSDKEVPTETYFVVRCSDNKIIGMTTLRLCLNKRFREFGQNIGYCIRPTERRKGYNKASLYLALLYFNQRGIDEIMVDCSKDNIGSALSIKAFDGKLVKEEYIVDLECIKQDYCINVKEAIYKYSKLYDEYVTLTSEEKIK